MEHDDMYKYDPAETEEKKRYRHELCQKDIIQRLKKVSEFVGLNYTLEATRRDGELLAVVKVLVRKNIITYQELDDCFWMAMDQLTANTESQKEKLRSQRMANKILIPGGKTVRG